MSIKWQLEIIKRTMSLQKVHENERSSTIYVQLRVPFTISNDRKNLEFIHAVQRNGKQCYISFLILFFSFHFESDRGFILVRERETSTPFRSEEGHSFSNISMFHVNSLILSYLYLGGVDWGQGGGEVGRDFGVNQKAGCHAGPHA